MQTTEAKSRHAVLVRPIQEGDRHAWTPLWDGYNAFYGRSGETALAAEITETTWRRFFEAGEPVFALVAEIEGRVVGFTHYIFHRNTTKIELTGFSVSDAQANFSLSLFCPSTTGIARTFSANSL